MPRISLGLATAATLLIYLPAFAGTLSCAKINGNLNCAGSGAVSCQTVNGRTVCTNGNHDVMQSFGGATADETMADGDDMADDVDLTPRHRHSSGR